MMGVRSRSTSDVRLLFGAIVAMLLTYTAIASAEGAGWRSPETVEGTTETSVEQAKTLHESGAVFIDVRNPRLFAQGHIPGAHHLDLKNGFEPAAVQALATHDEPVVIYCSGVKCSRSYRASAKAVSWGYTRVHYFRGGIVDWERAGHEVVVSD